MRKLAIALGCLLILLMIVIQGPRIRYFLFGGDITQSGTYNSESGNYFVVIDNPERLRYKVVSSRSPQQSATVHWGSDRYYWFCMWDEHDRLWIYSSQFGTQVFVPDGDLGEFVDEHSPRYDNLMKAAPKAYWDNPHVSPRR